MRRSATRLRLRVRARDVMLAKSAPADLSALNVLPGVVADIGAHDGPIVEIRLDCSGEALIARLTRYSVERLGLAPGRAGLRAGQERGARPPQPQRTDSGRNRSRGKRCVSTASDSAVLSYAGRLPSTPASSCAWQAPRSPCSRPGPCRRRPARWERSRCPETRQASPCPCLALPPPEVAGAWVCGDSGDTVCCCGAG